MQENNFEKQVQQKMEGLKLKPSDEVWQRVAVAVAKAKHDRRIFAVIFLLLLFISSTIFIVWDRKTGTKINDTISNNRNAVKPGPIGKSINDSSTRPLATVENKRITGNKNYDDSGIRSNHIALEKSTRDQPKSAAVPMPVKRNTVVKTKEPVNITRNIANSKDKDDVHNNPKHTYTARQKVKVLTGNSDPIDVENENGISGDARKIILGEIMQAANPAAPGAPVIDINGHANDLLERILQKADKEHAVKSSLQSKQGNEWKIGFNVSLGIAATQNGYLGIIGSGNGDPLKLFDNSYNQSNGGNTGTGSYVRYVPSKIKTGTGMVLGAFIQKSISPKTSLLFGLNYKTYRSALMIGNRVDSSVNMNYNSFFYRSGNTEKYKNHFHFLELPIAIRYRLTKENKVPVYLKTGVSISQLIGSDALQFDTASGSYYKHNRLLNKTQVNVSLGLLFSLSRHSKNPFLVGPDINYTLNTMSNSGFYRGRHYSYFGILLQKSFGRK